MRPCLRCSRRKDWTQPHDANLPTDACHPPSGWHREAATTADRGGRLIEVPAAYTSQTCAECGVVDARSRQDQARFVCTGCGHEANADTNAAIIILKRGLDKSLKPAEGHRSKRPDDAGSIRRAA